MLAYQDRDMRRNEKHHQDNTNGMNGFWNYYLKSNSKIIFNLHCHKTIFGLERFPKPFPQQALQPSHKSNLCMLFVYRSYHKLLKTNSIIQLSYVWSSSEWRILPLKDDGSGLILSSSSNKSSGSIISSSSLSIFHTDATDDLFDALANDSFADEPTS